MKLQKRQKREKRKREKSHAVRRGGERKTNVTKTAATFLPPLVVDIHNYLRLICFLLLYCASGRAFGSWKCL